MAGSLSAQLRVTGLPAPAQGSLASLLQGVAFVEVAGLGWRTCLGPACSPAQQTLGSSAQPGDLEGFGEDRGGGYEWGEPDGH